MPRNTLDDLNNHLFEQMERLNDDECSGRALTEEISRGRAMSMIATKIIDLSRVELSAAKLKAEYGSSMSTPLMIEGGSNGSKIND